MLKIHDPDVRHEDAEFEQLKERFETLAEEIHAIAIELDAGNAIDDAIRDTARQLTQDTQAIAAAIRQREGARYTSN